MNEIGRVPDSVTNAGLEFSYATWTPGTNIQMCQVPWGNDYRDIVRFDSQTALDNYLDNNSGPVVAYDRMTYLRPGEPIRIPLPFNDAYRYNYLRVRNIRQAPAGESVPRTFYYFINDIRHVAPNTTELIVQLDVWQTFNRFVEFGRCYVERGHVGIADVNTFTNYGRTYLTQPEGFDLGSEYSIEDVYRKYLARASQDDYDIIVVSNVDLGADYGTQDAPIMRSAKGSSAEFLPNGQAAYWFGSRVEFLSYMAALSHAPWISQGIVGVYAIPNNVVYPANMDDVTYTVNVTGATLTGTLHALTSSAVKTYDVFDLGVKFRDTLATKKLSGRYKYLKKFLTYPYSVVELTTYSGVPLVLKPECLNSDRITIQQLSHIVPPGQRIVWTPKNYNKGHGTSDVNDDGAEYLDLQTGMYNFPSFSVLNDSYGAFMAQNAHSIAFQHQTADWSQQKALSANQMSYDVSSAGMQLNENLTNLAISQANQMTAVNNQANLQRTSLGVVQDLGGATAGFMLGGGAGVASLAGAGAHAIGRGIENVITTNQNNQQTAIGNTSASQRTGMSNANTGYVRDTNKSYADYAAKGDYANSIAAINAKVQDARLVQPTTSGQVGGDAHLLATNGWLFYAKVKMIQENAMVNIGEYWLRYGYALNRFVQMPQDVMVMSKFTYWRVKEFYLRSAACPEGYKQTIRGIFEKGVTVWRNPSDIGRIDVADNEPIVKGYFNG